MNKKYIIDSSAFLASIYEEDSTFDFEKYMPYSVMHAINVSEVVAVLLRNGMRISIAEKIIQNNISEILNSNIEEAILAAKIRVENKEHGISTGDSFCLAAAKLNNYPVITTDTAWTRLNIGIEIIYAR